MGEMIGSFFLLFFLSAISMGDYLDNGRMDLVQHGLMAGFTIMVIIFSIGHISGSHVNPAVTIAFAAIAKFPWIQVTPQKNPNSSSNSSIFNIRRP
jgi:aquaporin NIP